MPTVESSRFVLPGAELYYETRGMGPTVVLIPGGDGDTGPFEGIAATLAERFRVVSYTRRGFSRSPIDGEPGTDRVATDSEDLRRLLDHVGGVPAHVLGCSAGAIVAMDFLTRYPHYVTTLIAHEPPYFSLLPDARERYADIDDAYAVYRNDGLDAGLRRFAEVTGLGPMGGAPESDDLPQRVRDMLNRIRSNMGFGFEHEARQYPRTVPDVEALTMHRDKIVLGCGEDSKGTLAYRPNIALAELLGMTATHFPGGHSGYAKHPRRFGELLTRLLVG